MMKGGKRGSCASLPPSFFSGALLPTLWARGGRTDQNRMRLSMPIVRGCATDWA